MWPQLNKKSVGLLVLLVLFSLVPSCLYSVDEPALTREEIVTWSEEKKTQAILMLDSFLTTRIDLIPESEQGLVLREVEISRREIESEQRETDCDEREAILTQQEAIYATYRTNEIEEFWKGFLTGQTKGLIETIAVAVYVHNNR